MNSLKLLKVLIVWIMVSMRGLMIGLQLQAKILPGSIKKRIEPSSMLEVQQNGDLAEKGTRILTATISKVHTGSPLIVLFLGPIKNRINGNPYY